MMHKQGDGLRLLQGYGASAVSRIRAEMQQELEQE
jgi:hypothetical protein